MDRAELLAIARGAAAEAAALLRDAWGGEVRADQKSAERGIVTSLDLTAESRIREAVLSRRPNDEWLGEETGARPGETGVEWIVDPLDGTNNYVAGLPQWAVSIGVRMNGRIQLGVIDMPAIGDVYTAIAGVGAWRNDEPLQVGLRRTSRLEHAVVATGFASDDARRLAQVEQLGRVLPQVRDIRCQGAASIELCGVAAGETDAYYESGLRVWDVAAGGLVATEAGLEVSGSPWVGVGTLVVAPASLDRPLRNLVDSGLGDG